MRRLHSLVGLCALGAFLASGVYMKVRHLPSLDGATRLIFRSTHIYLLFTALLNLVFGLYIKDAHPHWRMWLRRVGSALVMFAPGLCVLAFLREPSLTGLSRPYTLPAIIVSLVGVLCHLASGEHTTPGAKP
jgi:hypothetical protein